MHILDDIVVKIMHQVFDKMKSATSDMIAGSTCQKQMALLQGDLKRARAENTKANTDYESLKAEVLKAVQGKSALPTEVLNELLEETRSDTATQKMICGYIIKRVRVYRDYQLSMEFNINIEQFLNGIDSVEQTDSFQQVMAQ